ncbi:MAG: HAMP domain-containing histidine kinase [Ruminococcus sp.]|nr:HAMP domain-containing histidine kinase [Ruminococcus sp.]
MISKRNRKRNRPKKNTIVRRWMLNNLGLIVLLLLVIVLAVVYALQNYYYSSAKQYLNTKINSVSSVLTRYAQDADVNFSAELRSTLENFSDKDKMELMAIDSKGRVILTSSGFPPADNAEMPDYQALMEGGEGYWVGTMNDEKMMAVSVDISGISTEYNAIRVMTSLREIDGAMGSYVAAVAVGCILIVGLLLITGTYFVNSIVKPITAINETTKKFAKGDFSDRIEKQTEDEIGVLSDSINHMAEALASTEAMKNEFISSVSHELRTPLTAIKGWAETLAYDVDKETMHKGVRVIQNETERLSEMVEELLDFSRMQSGRFSLQRVKMDLLAELGDAVLIYAEKARRENIRIIYHEPDMLPFVNGDKNRIRQVFINIIDNAIKYSNAGCTVTVGAEAVGNKIQVMVTDNGVGISAQDLPRVKTKFFKANQTRRGSGIGLAVADEIITMHGGTLKIDSELGVGTSVTITLPVMKEPAGNTGEISKNGKE